MTTRMILATPQGLSLFDESLTEQAREHGPPSDLCTVYSPSQSTLYLSKRELEEFEHDTHLQLHSDCPTAKQWQRLFKWLLKNVGLFDVSGNVVIKLNRAGYYEGYTFEI